MNCEKCSSCNENLYFDCKGCTGCNSCFDSIGAQNPIGFKGHSMITCRHGLVVYGGITWPMPNI